MAKINEKKYEAVILYLTQKLGGKIKGKKKLAKLLYFVDFDFFEKYEKPFTGDTYKALPMGPYPLHMEKIVKNLVQEKKLEIKSVEEWKNYNATEVYKEIGRAHV